MTRAWWILALVCAAAPAHAERVTKVFPLSGSALPRPLRALPGELTRVIAKAHAADVAATPIEDAAELIGCELDARSCLASIADKVGASTIVFGRIERKAGAIVVRVTKFDPATGEHEKTFTLEGETADELASSLERGMTEKPAPTEPGPTIIEDPPAKPRPSSEAGAITTGTWALLAGGGVGVAGGLGFLASANSLSGDIRRAPTATRDDIDRLRALEGAARTRTQIGAGLLIAGGAVATIGVVRAVIQHRAPAREQPVVDVVPEQGGASIVLNVRWH